MSKTTELEARLIELENLVSILHATIAVHTTILETLALERQALSNADPPTTWN